MEVKSSGFAIVLSFFWTGLGQLYAGKIGRGLAMMVATPLIWSFSFLSGCWGACAVGGAASNEMLRASGEPTAGTAGQSAMFGGLGFAALLFLLLPLAWWVWGMVDAKKQCERFNAAARESLTGTPDSP